MVRGYKQLMSMRVMPSHILHGSPVISCLINQQWQHFDLTQIKVVYTWSPRNRFLQFARTGLLEFFSQCMFMRLTLVTFQTIL